VRLAAIAPGDVVLVNRRGRGFYALVRGQLAGGELQLEPLDRRISYRHASARELVGHWARQGRPRAAGAGAIDGQLALELESRP
jgi:hypothetical protein